MTTTPRSPTDRERFEIKRKLGSGGMGVVYEALDRQRNVVVALKTLRSLDGPTLYRFKREFRALADITHPNLVTIHELISIDGEWLFTMELIRGGNFLEHVRPGSGKAPGTATPRPTPARAATPLPGAPAVPTDYVTLETALNPALPVSTESVSLDVDRLRLALRQLCEGVAFLHVTGRLHRDLKPSNVLVEEESGRVVVCDFGLVAELGGLRTYETTSDRIVGTAVYMSPEQATGLPLSEASDWYSVGVVLYQALTGVLPMALGAHGPAPPRALVPSVPPDLDQLCAALLRPAAAERPPREEILRRVGGREVGRDAQGASVSDVFVGREPELAVLHQALAGVRAGGSGALFVRGPSGIGKTALVRAFLRRETQDREVLVFSGRCYQNEAVPYKALDGIVDELSSYLAHLAPADVERVLPPDTADLARLFPVLGRVPLIAEPERRRFGAQDPHLSRQRAFVALRELLGAVAAERPLVLFIDDLQWGDAESAPLLHELLRRPEVPRLLVLATYRSEGADASPLLAELGRSADDRRAVPKELEIAPLAPDEASRLARELWRGARLPPRVEAIARESGGHPLLVGELVRHLAAAGADPDLPAVHLDDMLRLRIERLPEGQRDLLSLIAAFGRPMPEALVEDLRHGMDELSVDLARLSSAHLVRRQGGRGGLHVETFHDRVREATLSLLDAETRRGYHRRIATALHRTGAHDAEALVEHWLAAGERERASLAARPAAQHAAATLAFDRAARLYTFALEHAHAAEDARALRAELAEALVNAGRGPEAAQAFLEVAATAPAAQALALKRRAALELLRSGRMDEGLLALQQVMEPSGLHMPKTPLGAVARLLWQRMLLRLRGLRFTLRDESQVSAEQLARVDVCWTAGIGLGMVDTIRGAQLQAQFLWQALRTGERTRVARALVLEIAYLSINEGTRARARRLIAVARPLVEAVGALDIRGLFDGVIALHHYQGGEFVRAREIADEVVPVLRRCVGSWWETTTAEVYRLWSLYYLGEIGEMTDSIRALTRETADRGDVYAGSMVRTGVPALATLLTEDDAAFVQARVQSALESWTKRGFHLQHYWAGLALGHLDLYAERGPEALGRARALWPDLRRSFLDRVNFVHAEVNHLQGRAALAAARAGGSQRAEHLREAERCGKILEKTKVRSLSPLGTMIRAEVLATRGNAEAALAGFTGAEQICAGNQMALFAAAARYRRGELQGGDEGAALRASAEADLRARRVADPARALHLFAPRARP